MSTETEPVPAAPLPSDPPPSDPPPSDPPPSDPPGGESSFEAVGPELAPEPAVPETAPKRRWGLAIVWAAWIVSLVLWFQPGLTFPDTVGTFSYLPSAVLGGDLVLYDEWRHVGLVATDGRVLHAEITPTGMLGHPWTAGAAAYWLPAFAAGHAVALRLRAASDGYSLPHSLPAMLASAIAGLLALIVSWRLALRVAPRGATIAVVGAWFGSPLFFWSIRNSLVPHAAGAMIGALLVLCAVRLRERVDVERTMAFGLAVGFAFAVRPQNAIFAAVPLFMAVDSIQLKRILRFSPLALLAAIVGALPQLVVSASLYGTPWGFLHAGGEEGVTFAPFERIRILEPLISWFHGMLPWTPLLGLALAGLWFLWRDDRGLARAALFCFAAQWAITASLDRVFWGGFAFGQPRFADFTVFFVLGLASLLSRIPRWVGIVLVTTCSAWTMGLALAAPAFDLGTYQAPGVLAQAVIEAVKHVGTWVVPLARVPRPAHGAVTIGLLACIVVAAVAALLSRWLSPRARLAVALAWILSASAVFAWAGIAGRSHLAMYDDAIAYNRSLGMRSGAVLHRLGLLRQEVQWLVAVGRVDDAARTRAEIEDIERRQEEGAGSGP